MLNFLYILIVDFVKTVGFKPTPSDLSTDVLTNYTMPVKN